VKSIQIGSAPRILLGVLILGAIAPHPIARAQSSESIEVLRVRPNFYIIAGAGGNIGVQIGVNGVVLVDSGARGTSAQVLAEIRKLTDKPIRYIINTSADADRVGGNADLAKAGQSIFLVDGARTDFVKAMTGGAASIMAHENVLTRMSAPTGKSSPFPSEAWPSETFSTDSRNFYFNREGIEVLHQPAAHTDGDSMVFFRISDVVMAGSILDTTRFPEINLKEGGSIQGEIEALNRLIKLAIPPGPYVYEEGGTFVIPGRGRISDQADAVEYRDMVVIVRDVIKDMMQRGMTLEQIKAASPVKPYEREFGSQPGPSSTSAFIEAVYMSLAAKK
jgi:glyoxylase-like metal-dependent hydrolase (beta-lactamase superfamily II)